MVRGEVEKLGNHHQLLPTHWKEDVSLISPFVRVERTLLSAAFGFGIDLAFAFAFVWGLAVVYQDVVPVPTRRFGGVQDGAVRKWKSTVTISKACSYRAVF